MAILLAKRHMLHSSIRRESVMSIVTHALPRKTGNWLGFWHSLARRISTMTASIAVERQRRRAIQELHTFDDRMLADIGLTRGDVENAVRFGRSQTGMILGAYDGVLQLPRRE
jgi:uncharacterized protein YjiS (DUF1127 family)